MRPMVRLQLFVLAVGIGSLGVGCTDEGSVQVSDCSSAEVSPGAGAPTPEAALHLYLDNVGIQGPARPPNLIRDVYVRDDTAVLPGTTSSTGLIDPSKQATFAHRTNGTLDATVVVVDQGNGWLVTAASGAGYTVVAGMVSACSTGDIG
jgi:hypothetical protein